MFWFRAEFVDPPPAAGEEDRRYGAGEETLEVRCFG